MTPAVRRFTRFSDDPERLAQQVGELSRDMDALTGTRASIHSWQGPVVLGEKFRVDVGGRKPDALMCVAVEDLTNRSQLVPGGVSWSWVNGQVQVDDTQIGFAAGDIYKVTFLAVRFEG